MTRPVLISVTYQYFSWTDNGNGAVNVSVTYQYFYRLIMIAVPWLI